MPNGKRQWGSESERLRVQRSLEGFEQRQAARERRREELTIRGIQLSRSGGSKGKQGRRLGPEDLGQSGAAGSAVSGRADSLVGRVVRGVAHSYAVEKQSTDHTR